MGNSGAGYALGADLSAHEADPTNVHGIVNTALLETAAGAQAKVDTHTALPNVHHAQSHDDTVHTVDYAERAANNTFTGINFFSHTGTAGSPSVAVRQSSLGFFSDTNHQLKFVSNSAYRVLFADTAIIFAVPLTPDSNGARDLGLDALRFGNLFLTAKANIGGEIEIDGTLNHDGTLVGFYGVAPVAQSAPYTHSAWSTTTRAIAAGLGTAVATTGATNTVPFGYTTAAQANDIVTQLNNLRTDFQGLKSNVKALMTDIQTVGLLG